MHRIVPRDSQRHKDLCDSFIAGCNTLQGKNPVIHTKRYLYVK